ncbi:VOC family protein [Mycobacterium sp. Z3061]|uniref:VOC family protein n=1 Tax=Mycobacterium sp. Z3061 TaxID=3073562 RepID=UPI002873897C|nr:VOC family protein [Mycobacterium sp. Z3061]
MSLRDPLNVLHTEDLPVQPDPGFAARLRARLESALSLPEGVVMSGISATISELSEQPAAAPRPAALPYLSLRDARAAIDWYAAAFGAVVVGEPIVMDDGRIGHAELEIGTGVLYLADEYPELGLRGPQPGAVSVSLMLHVADTDAALRRAREHGAMVQREIYEGHGARNATLVDPFGHRWMLSGPVATPIAGIRQGDLGYIWLQVPDAQRAADFYAHVLGWTVDAASHRVTSTDLPTDIRAGEPGMFCGYAVADLAEARAAITAAGGSVGETRRSEHGITLEATDPQGAPFAVFEPAAGRERPQLNGSGPGELAYVTYDVTESAGFRDFYGRVLGWTFEPGRVADGWQVRDAHPMSGAAGGSPRRTTVPMWTVDDIDAAVARVREAGGTVLDEPSRQPYGLSAECTDDQGSRFYLGQF